MTYFYTREVTSALHEIRTRRRQGNDGSAFTNLTPVNQCSQVLGSQTSFNFSTGAVSVMAARSTVPGMKLEHEEEDSYFPLSLCLLFAASILPTRPWRKIFLPRAASFRRDCGRRFSGVYCSGIVLAAL